MLVLGYTPNAISRLFWRESVTVHLLGTVVGLPLGYLLTLKAAEAFGNELARLPIVFSPWTVLAVIGISLAFHTVAHWFVRRRIVHLDWQESLKVKE